MKKHYSFHKWLLIIILLIACQTGVAQTTAIPDPDFEQALIDLGIDSDNAINGQVLTSDINTVASLDVSNYGINDLTGIADFAGLKILNVDENYLTDIDLSGNPLLEELYCSNQAFDVQTMTIDTINFSNNLNIQTVEAENLGDLNVVNLKNGNNNNMVSFSINLTFNPPADLGDMNDVCIQVDDENAANQNQPPYSSWTIGDGHMTYSFSENCLLGIKTAQKENIRIFPNPVKDFLNIQNPSLQLEKVEIYSIHGQKIKTIFENLARIDMKFLSHGVYFIKLYGPQREIEVRKFVKK